MMQTNRMVGMGKQEMMRCIQQLQFMTVELNLYLDTHPNDCRAIMEYNYYTQQLSMLKKQYERMYGPMTGFGYAPNQHKTWKWIEKWPWELDFEEESGC